ncbi:LCP2 [Symbiodinium pilosum]|uniref:LCP2 protein n=1 Tax=Symbiodinium pilosum TaxID=2952 RepID=A0A812VRT1_SYMPI|nr:LCP2 [Symbiodinium pilosum]
MGCTYDVEYDECRGCSDSHPDVTNFHIPASQLWKSRMEEHVCTAPRSHPCGKSCCCNAEWKWDLEQRQCVKAKVLLGEKPSPSPPESKPPDPDPIPGSQVWDSCEARSAYQCGKGHCCCMFGCTFDVEADSCTGCRANDPSVILFHIPSSHRWTGRKQAGCHDPYKCGSCDAKLSHRCGWSCCCNAGYTWNLEQRRPSAVLVLQPLAATRFKATKQRVEHLNKLNGEPAFGITWMADRYDQEKYKRGHHKPKGFVPVAPVRNFTNRARTATAVDWRLTEAVTPIKNQGQCGSCWAFSATEAVESQLIMASGGRYDIELSPQQITSCAPSTGTYGCQGCNGGFTEGAYEYLKTVPGLANSFYIPYEQSLTESTDTAACPKSKVDAMNGPYMQLSGGYAAVTGYSYAVKPCTEGTCEHQDLKGLAAAIAESPISVCVNAGVWNDYTGGVLSAAACGPMGADYQDHCVMAVGYNSTAPKPYWIVRNSWASTWGIQGYIYLEMDKNTCGVADDATIPHVKVDLTEDEAKEAAARREAMFRRASEFATEPAVQMVV